MLCVSIVPHPEQEGGSRYESNLDKLEKNDIYAVKKHFNRKCTEFPTSSKQFTSC